VQLLCILFAQVKSITRIGARPIGKTEGCQYRPYFSGQQTPSIAGLFKKAIDVLG
jgi:hypothetical protein